MATCKSLARISPSQRPHSLLPLIQTRHESSTRRHKKLLVLPQAPSYTPSRSTPTLIFNPPSSAPSVFHTPLKFLPQTDSRRPLYASAAQHALTSALRRQTSPIAAPGTPLSAPSALPPRPTSALPPALRAPYEKKYHLSAAEIEEIRALRAEDPEHWTRVRLAERFGCSQFFVGMVAKNKGKAERVEKEHEEARRRKVLWGMDG
ncbi:hypothetical protein IQ07DRAFT_341801 [Pyrenochaeta sp. DS3sAY3a]|nr:hypothetical protein IQ07DRAFT_341801 [Pyrenochaeta sp. DS3sAY3a]